MWNMVFSFFEYSDTIGDFLYCCIAGIGWNPWWRNVPTSWYAFFIISVAIPMSRLSPVHHCMVEVFPIYFPTIWIFFPMKSLPGLLCQCPSGHGSFLSWYAGGMQPPYFPLSRCRASLLGLFDLGKFLSGID